MFTPAVVLMTEIATSGTSTYSRTSGSCPYFGEPEWQEPASDLIGDALKASGVDAAQVSWDAVKAARAVLNLLSDLPQDPVVTIEGDEITLEWYKDRHHVAVVAVDGESVSWSVMAGPGNPKMGKSLFDQGLPDEAYAAISAVGSA